MPNFNVRPGHAGALSAVLAAALLVTTGARAQGDATGGRAAAGPAPSGAPEPVRNSDLNAPLFQELLVSEIEVREGDPAAGYQLMLDAARRTKDEQLFKRATEIAVQARAGDDALATIKAWRLAVPGSLDALRYEIELLVQLNRTPEAVEPLETLLKLAPSEQRPALINAVPRLLARNNDHDQTAQIIERVLLPYADAPDTRVAARVAIGRGWLAAINGQKALALAQSAHDMEPAAEAPAGLALDMLPGTPAAEEIVKDHLAAKPDSSAVRLLYVRTLLASQRLVDATTQLDTLTRTAPALPQAWLTLGALHVQLREPDPAIVALTRYIELVQASDLPATDAAQAAAAAASEDDDPPPTSKEEALTRGYLLLSQAADLKNDLRGAQEWLGKIDNPKRALEVQARRASLLAREGKVREARELIRRLPEKTPDDARAKLLAEAQMLRDAKLWRDANDLLAQGNKKYPDDADLMYEQSMMAEKLNRLADMERLLRRVIELKPENQQAYNALGYAFADRNVRLPEARTLIQKAMQLSPNEPSITDSMGWVEYRLGHKAEAVRLLRDAYKGQPDAEIAAHLGEVLWVSGQTDEARQIWRDARKRDAANDVLRETLARLRVDL